VLRGGTNLKPRIDFVELARALLGAGLLVKAEQAVGRALTADAEDPRALEVLGLIRRRRGDLPGAATTYAQLSRLAPGMATVDALCDTLNRGCRAPDHAEIQIEPVPFVILSSFLPEHRHEELLDGLGHRKREPSTMGEGHFRPEMRLQTRLSETDDIRAWFISHLEAVLPEIGSRLRVCLSPREAIELMLTVARDGDFFDAHKDNCPPAATRRLTFVYYFHCTPKRFKGGDLLLFDTDQTGSRYYPGLFTRLIPEDNSIVFFPTGFVHAVTRVACPSGLIEDGRLALNGHVRVGIPT